MSQVSTISKEEGTIPISRIMADVSRNPIPVFDMVETDTHYLLSVDLPGAPVDGAEIEMRGDELRVLMHNRENDDPGVLFRCKTLGKKVRAVYWQGALWLSLPKGAAFATTT